MKWLCCFIIYISLIINYSQQHQHQQQHQQQQQQKCPTHLKYQQLDADYIIAGFLPAHIWNGAAFIINKPSIGWSSALAYAVYRVNQNTTLLPGIKLGFDIRDSCDNVRVASEEALEFVLDTEYLRPRVNASQFENEICFYKNDSYRIVAGVIGGASSTLSAVLSNLLGTDFIPQISYSATSMSLSNRKYYRNFARTVPSDIYQAEAIADLLKACDWTYVSAFASDDDYGRLGLHELRTRIKERGLCLAADKTFTPFPSKNETNDIIKHLRTFSGSTHVVILWCQRSDALKILREAALANISNILWIGTETWGTNKGVIDNLKGKIIGLDVWQPPVTSFNTYFENGYEDDFDLCGNPWVNEFADEVFGVPGMCETAIQLGAMELLELKKVPQMIGAVITLAHALHGALGCNETNCSQVNGKLNYENIYKNILKQKFFVLKSDFHVEIDENGDSSQNSYEFRFLNNEDKSNQFVSFGDWKGTGQLNVNKSLLDWGSEGKPISHCSDTCLPGFYKIDSATQCCWSCAQCRSDYISTTNNQKKCIPCSMKTQMANANHTRCIDLDHLYFKYSSGFGIGAIFASCFGFVLTLAVLLVFIYNWDTPIVKSSSREMSCLQLSSLMLLFCLPAVHMVEASVPVCILRTLLFGFLFTTVIAIIVTKTYRLHRVFNERFTKVSKFLHNKYQIFFSYLIVLILVVVLVSFNVFLPQETFVERHRSSGTVHIQCGDTDHILLWIILAYCFILALTSGYVCFRARKLPENFNETQYICFAMFTICVVWLMFVPLYASLHAIELTVAFLSINYVSTLSLLLILYGYKVRIIVLLPEYNSPEHFRKTAAKATIAHFQRDVEGGRQRYQSVVMFDYIDSSPPRRRLSLTTDITIPLDNDDAIKQSILRRASFSGLSHRESTRVSHVSIENLLKPFGEMTKSKSTPMLLDASIEFKPKTLWKPGSHMFGRMVSATSLNRMFTDRNMKTSVELKGLLADETHL